MTETLFTPTEPAPAKCEKRIYGRGRGMMDFGRPCGRPVKAEGMCAVHLGAKKRAEQAELKQVNKFRAQEDALKVAAERTHAINARLVALGLPAGSVVTYHAAEIGRTSMRRATVTFEALEKLLDLTEAGWAKPPIGLKTPIK